MNDVGTPPGSGLFIASVLTLLASLVILCLSAALAGVCAV